MKRLLIRHLHADEQRQITFHAEISPLGFLEERHAPQAAGTVLFVVLDDLLRRAQVDFFLAFAPEFIVDALVELVVHGEEPPQSDPAATKTGSMELSKEPGRGERGGESEPSSHGGVAPPIENDRAREPQHQGQAEDVGGPDAVALSGHEVDVEGNEESERPGQSLARLRRHAANTSW